MSDFVQTCKQVDAQFYRIMGTPSMNEPEVVMLIRAAAKMTMTTYPDHCHRSMGMIQLLKEYSR
jgi:hypothetical protein